ncbi:MAG TPA: hypothetical protein VLJ14_00435 [Ktedonobacterales bacterium]|jgi:hypothetical protein|nr:hypothetical protein [Ktedonobacterales bacterium]
MAPADLVLIAKTLVGHPALFDEPASLGHPPAIQTEKPTDVAQFQRLTRWIIEATSQGCV